MNKLPPNWMMRFFRWFCREDLADAVEGDLLELYRRRSAAVGEKRANWRYFWQILTFLRPFAIKKRTRSQTLNPLEMLKLHLKFAFRNLLRTKFYSFTNIASLATGIAATLLLLAFISEELSYDKFHEDGDRVYRFGYIIESDNQPTRELAWVSALVGPAAQEAYPEIEHMVRIRNCAGTMIAPDNQTNREENGFFAGDEFFDVFSFPLSLGDPKTALDAPYKIVLTQQLAQKYFGDENPLGQNLSLVIRDTLDLQVTGVVADVPDNAHFSFDYLISHDTREAIYPHIQGWFALGTHTYIKLAENTSMEAFEQKSRNLVMDAYGEEASSIGFALYTFLQPLWDIHLKSNLGNEIEANGDINYVYVAMGIALIIFVIAIVNFINLFIARSVRFVRQAGIRQVMGARKRQLINQFMTESLFSVMLALGLGLVIAYALLPYFEMLVTRQLSIEWLGPLSVITLAALLLLFGGLAGLYPALLITSLKMTDSMKGSRALGQKKSMMKQGLVVLQFGMATLLISAVLVVRGQLNFMMDSSLGFDKEQVAVIELWNSDEASDNPEVLKSKLLQTPGISGVTTSNSIPGRWLLNRVGYPDGDESLAKVMFSLLVADDFPDLFDLEIIAGRTFSKDLITDQTEAFLINESSLKEFGWTTDEAIGREFQWGSRAGKIIGVVKDFHYYSLQEAIPPMIILQDPGAGDYMSVKIQNNFRETASFIEDTWQSLYPDNVLSMYFLDDSFNEQYQLESQLDKIMTLFTVVAILVACFGLFSLSAIHVEQRTKEIGIRKVLGASVSLIQLLIGRFFLKLVAISFIFAIPAAYLLSAWWLNDFAFRMELSPLIFLGAAITSLLVAGFTVFVQSFRSATSNPVNTLRYE